jgi:hypothetical protein
MMHPKENVPKMEERTVGVVKSMAAKACARGKAILTQQQLIIHGDHEYGF